MARDVTCGAESLDVKVAIRIMREVAHVEHVHLLGDVVDGIFRRGPLDVSTHEVPEGEHLFLRRAPGHSQ
jgi:hypothetical protein